MPEAAAITPEAAMLQRYAAGDGDAVDQLVATYQQPAFWVAWHLVRDHDIATDLVQEAFLKVLRKPDRYDPNRPFKAWFLRVVHNLGIDWLRRHRQHAVQELVDQAGAYDPNAGGDRLERLELKDRVAFILDQLPAKYRELIVMRDVEGLEPIDMAASYGVEPGTMRFRIHYARKVFRKLWLEHFGEEP